MTVVDTIKDADALTLTIVSEFTAPVDRVWQVWADPRQLERWWGPPTWPATVTDHDLVVGGRVAYSMTGPDGEKAHGLWQIRVVEPPHTLEYEDRFADDAGEPDDSMPVTVGRVELAAAGTGTRMSITTTFASVEAMEQMITMGMLEGMTLALSQIEGVLTAG